MGTATAAIIRRAIATGSFTILSSSQHDSDNQQDPPCCDSCGGEQHGTRLSPYELSDDRSTEHDIGKLSQRVGNYGPLSPIQA